jgi:hypothetical protein
MSSANKKASKAVKAMIAAGAEGYLNSFVESEVRVFVRVRCALVFF